MKKIIVRGCFIILTAVLAIPVAANAYMPFFIVESESMLPSYKIGSVVLVHNYQPKQMDPWVGRVIVFFNHASRKIIVHRVIGIDGGYLVTKGDNNPTADTYSPTVNDVLGVVYANIPGG
jgi:signal peptidase I